MADTKLYNVQEVATVIGSSTQTINAWYKWKALHADHGLAELLPDYQRIGNKRTRYWTESDIWQLLQFKQSIPIGRNGVMGDVTQKYTKKKKGGN